MTTIISIMHKHQKQTKQVRNNNFNIFLTKICLHFQNPRPKTAAHHLAQREVRFGNLAPAH